MSVSLHLIVLSTEVGGSSQIKTGLATYYIGKTN